VTLTRSAEVGDKAAARATAAESAESLFEYMRALGPEETIRRFEQGAPGEYLLIPGLPPPPVVKAVPAGQGVVDVVQLLTGGAPVPDLTAPPNGQVELILDETRTDATAARFGCPRVDLDGDGACATRDIRGRARLVPVYVTIRWRTANGEGRLDAYALIGR